MLLALGGCVPDAGRLHRELESFDPARRLRATKAVAESEDQRFIPALVDRLSDEDVAVRFGAILALERLTGERFGYNSWSPPEERQKAIESWRAYVAARASSQLAGDATAAGAAGSSGLP